MSNLEVSLLTDDAQRAELCELYWALDVSGKFQYSISELADCFKLKHHEVPRIVGKESYALDTSDRCPACGDPRRYSSRSAYELGSRYSVEPHVCECCQAEAREQRAAALLTQQEIRREKVRSYFQPHGKGDFDPATLSLRDALHLLSFVAASDTPTSVTFTPESFPHKLAPTPEYREVIRDGLYRHHLIAWHDSSPESAFTFAEDGSIPKFYPARVVWKLGIRETHPENLSAIGALDTFVRKEPWPTAWEAERANVWREIAVEECVEFLNFHVAECRFESPPLEKSKPMLDALLADYTVGQVCYMIWRGIQYATHQKARGFVSYDHAVNYLLKTIRKKGEDAKEKNWDVYQFTRNTNIPISVVALWYYKVFLRLPADEGVVTKIPDHSPSIF